METNAANELIKLYAKQLRLPSFNKYAKVVQLLEPSESYADFLLKLMKTELDYQSQDDTAKIVAPVDSSRYTSQFGYRINPITNVRAFHTGLDIAAPLGTKIKAAYNGTVSKTGEDSHSGKYIFLTHANGLETFYCHCSEIIAEKGAKIRQGETIALVGSTGWSTGPHLHFEIHKNGKRLDPLPFLQG